MRIARLPFLLFLIFVYSFTGTSAAQSAVTSTVAYNLQGEQISHLQPGEEFLFQADLSITGEEVALVEAISYSGGQVQGIRQAHVPLERGMGSLSLMLQAPQELEMLTIQLNLLADSPEKLGVFPFLVVDAPQTWATGKIIALGEDFLELAELGSFPLSPVVKVVRGDPGGGNIKGNLDMGQLYVGQRVQVTTFEGEVIEIRLPQQNVPLVRIAITSDLQNGIYHDKLQITSDKGITLFDRVSGQEKWVDPNKIVHIILQQEQAVYQWDGNQLVSTGRVYLTPARQGKLEVASLDRGTSHKFSPVYRGVFEITPNDSGLLIINEIEMEKYLYQVLPSEVLPGWPEEVLKAQAVAARTYALRAIFQGRYRVEGFHLLDSVSSQAYNNQREADSTTEAVDQTAGQVIIDQQGELIQTYFHSTSPGVTGNSYQIWDSSSELPYLSRRSTLYSGELPDLSSEQSAAEFLRNREPVAFDSLSPWYRWEVNLTGSEVTSIINHNLGRRYQAQPHLVLTKTDQGFLSSPIDSLGSVMAINVISRGISGNIMELEIVGSEHTIRVANELTIRSLLSPNSQYTGGEPVPIHRYDNSTVKDFPLLPSAYFTLEARYDQEGNMVDVTIYGGGSGHGIGMSQWAAMGMAVQGYNHEEILAAFYAHTELVDIRETLP